MDFKTKVDRMIMVHLHFKWLQWSSTRYCPQRWTLVFLSLKQMFMLDKEL